MIWQKWDNTSNRWSRQICRMMPTIHYLRVTGDGIAMMYRAKGHMENMESVQFHPTALYRANPRILRFDF
ncbi:MAG: FAD-binding protein [Saprospiraceae bacterium]|nr:FAD-binding protein [Saprospiraceae bacterium]